MNHSKRFEILSEYLDGEAEKSLHAEITLHLKDCGECRALLVSLRQDREHLRAMRPEPLSTSFAASVRREVTRQFLEERTWEPAERLAQRIVFALAVVVILVIWYTFKTAEPMSGLVETYYSGGQQDSAAAAILTADQGPTKEDLLLALGSK